MTPAERFAVKIVCDLRTGCWMWTGAKYRSKNYWVASFRVHAKTFNLAKLVLELTLKRSLQPGYQTCHVRHCSSSLCVRPSHLYEGTQSDNMLDRFAVSPRTHCFHGHEFTEENTYLVQDRRKCRACHRVRARDFERRRRASA